VSPTAIGIALALAAAIALDGSFLIQHAGSPAQAVDARRPLATMAALLRSPLWTLGAVAGMTGWALHIAAMREAPLSLVQAFVAGGLALAVPMAAIGLRVRPARADVHAIGLMVVALVGLSAGIRADGPHSHADTAALGLWIGAQCAAATLLAATVRGRRRAGALGVSGGLLYGAADLALKAVTGAGVASAWLPVAALTTAGAFFAFQRGLQSDRPLAVIALMTAATNASSIAGAFAAFGDPLGRTPALAVVHALALALVVVAAWRLAPAQARVVSAATSAAQSVPSAITPVSAWVDSGGRATASRREERRAKASAERSPRQITTFARRDGASPGRRSGSSSPPAPYGSRP
jgi:hypothetical protein